MPIACLPLLSPELHDSHFELGKFRRQRSCVDSQVNIGLGVFEVDHSETSTGSSVAKPIFELSGGDQRHGGRSLSPLGFAFPNVHTVAPSDRNARCYVGTFPYA